MTERKPNRLQSYDYSQNGAYFITVCTLKRKALLSSIAGDDACVCLKPYGKVVEKYILNVPEIEKYVIMPDHIHLLIRLDNGSMWASIPTENEAEPAVYRNSGSKIANIIRSIKILTTKEIGKPIFQRSYYDHIIRNVQDYNETWEYIEKNPKMWILNKKEK